MKNFSKNLILIPFTLAPWVAFVFAQQFTAIAPRSIGLPSLYVAEILFFVMSFFLYNKTRSRMSPFSATVKSIALILVFELLRWFGQNGIAQTYDFINWVLPFFLAATTTYWVSAIMQTATLSRAMR